MFNDYTTSTQVSAHGSVTQGSHGSDNSAQVVTKVHGVKQGAPWVVHEVFVSDPRPLTPHPVLTPLKKLRVSTEAPNLTMVRARKSTVPPHRRKAFTTEDVVSEQSVRVGSICCLPTWSFTDD
jgi:hypothetical protein